MTLRHSLLAAVALWGIVSAAHGADRASVADLFSNDSLRPSIQPTLGGVVIGATGGFTWGEAEFSTQLVPDLLITDDLDAWDGGVLLGYEFVADRMFSGFEVLGSFGGPEKDHDFGGGVTASYGIDGHIDARIRAGFMATDRIAAFAIAGATFARVTVEASDGVNSFDEDDWRIGGVGGAGLEFLLTPNLSVAAEYTFTSLGEETYFDLVTVDSSYHAVRGAVRVRF